MKQKLEISLIQLDVFWLDKEKNLKKIEELIDRSPKSDIFLLPEMFNTGFYLKPFEIAEDWDGLTVMWMKRVSEKYGVALGGSIVFKENGKFYNRFLFVEGENIEFYDKRHTFSMAGENKYFTKGNKIKTIEFKGWKIRLLVCYDLRFPVWSRNTDEYDLAVYVANWPASRIEQWKSLLIARAIENQAYVIGVNRIGKDGNGFDYAGKSLVADFKGEILLQLPDNKEVVRSVVLDADLLKKSREKFPVLRDRDKFVIAD